MQIRLKPKVNKGLDELVREKVQGRHSRLFTKVESTRKPARVEEIWYEIPLGIDGIFLREPHFVILAEGETAIICRGEYEIGGNEKTFHLERDKRGIWTICDDPFRWIESFTREMAVPD